ncbi:hypothetical protein F2Q69_00024398 [Brassica cretica]|uniref:Uncharacterized protein n=1 Tax=Brassica cretica TaxID=69181 RepID=A0A8S9QGY1_BRACR|nr:hypothetical protein F2Q69_00024398 [Brassica cretica]
MGGEWYSLKLIQMMKLALQLFRKLKKWLIVCLHDGSLAIWILSMASPLILDLLNIVNLDSGELLAVKQFDSYDVFFVGECGHEAQRNVTVVFP